MNPTAEQIQKINHFSKVPLELCGKIASAVKIIECGPKEKLLNKIFKSLSVNKERGDLKKFGNISKGLRFRLPIYFKN